MSEIKRNGHGAMDMTQGSPTRLIVLSVSYTHLTLPTNSLV